MTAEEALKYLQANKMLSRPQKVVPTHRLRAAAQFRRSAVKYNQQIHPIRLLFRLEI